VIKQIEHSVAPLESDRFLAPDLTIAAEMIRDGNLIENITPAITSYEERTS